MAKESWHTKRLREIEQAAELRNVQPIAPVEGERMGSFAEDDPEHAEAVRALLERPDEETSEG